MDYDDIDHLCSHIDNETSASELHGVVTGVICRSRPGTDMDAILHLLCDDPDSVDTPWREQLLEFCNITAGRLAAMDFEFGLLLPGDGDGLEWQTEELGAWCRGFLLGMTECLNQPDLPLDVEADEFITDLTAISGAQTGDDGETDQRALAELVEYVRAGVQLVYESFRQADTTTPQPAH